MDSLPSPRRRARRFRALWRCLPLSLIFVLQAVPLPILVGCSGEQTVLFGAGEEDREDAPVVLEDPSLPDAFVGPDPPSIPDLTLPLPLPFRNIGSDTLANHDAVTPLIGAADWAPDGIKPIENPEWVAADAVDPVFLRDSDVIIGVENGREARAYPVKILLHHEIVRTCWIDPGPKGVAVTSLTYCPLVDAGISFIPPTDCGNPKSTGFGVSGLVFNQNLVFYDRSSPTDDRAIYGQMMLGGFDGLSAEMHVTAGEATWGFWKKLYPHTQVMSENVGLSPHPDYRDENHPYVDFWKAGWIWYPEDVEPFDNRLFMKAKIMGTFVGGVQKAYEVTRSPVVLNDMVSGVPIAYWSWPKGGMACVYERTMESNKIGDPGTLTLTFSLRGTKNGLPVFEDEETGTLWNLAGIGIEGRFKGRRMARVPSYKAFWYAWNAHFPETELWKDEGS